ncbi:nucleoside triphosphate pyrophosphohydrolase family protein [Psychrobacter faecalis]|uniref:Nucleoside triphosphate pyrophosphohydrolase family protein n=1 Tax=Psychrobacter faecalis TaxID=180588 RepID=A0ABT9HJE0_9GAMM|nr:nucleoside triphosphate pyrophosphohydrolase family protein [Psychrobacter faecalis]MDP4545883.1 nucleoside triphosphate pyrophosphohydrolase family protein [Psychrobacter faecalis]
MLAPVSISESPLHHYVVLKDGDGIKVRYSKKGADFDYATGFATIDEAKAWAWNHYNEKMQPYVKPDSITDIANWFKAAKPEPTHDDVIAQMACHFEEVDEMIDSTNIHPFTNHLYEVRRNCKQIRDNNLSSDCISKGDNLELLDALCDQIVTATGVAYMMGFDIEGALKEVIRSNNSKMVDGKFIFDDNGKITKPESYSEPDLTPFISTMQILHKGE